MVFRASAGKFGLVALVLGAITIVPFMVVRLVSAFGSADVDGFWRTGSLILTLMFVLPFIVMSASAIRPPELIFEQSGIRIKGVGGTLDLPFSQVRSMTIDIDASRGRPAPWLVVTLDENASVPRKVFFFPSPVPSRNVAGGLKVFPLQWLSVPYGKVDAFGRRFFPDIWS